MNIKGLALVALLHAVGGGVYLNANGKTSTAPNQTYFEADLAYRSGKRGSERVIFSNGGKTFFTNDHYETLSEIK